MIVSQAIITSKSFWKSYSFQKIDLFQFCWFFTHLFIPEPLQDLFQFSFSRFFCKSSHRQIFVEIFLKIRDAHDRIDSLKSIWISDRLNSMWIYTFHWENLNKGGNSEKNDWKIQVSNDLLHFSGSSCKQRRNGLFYLFLKFCKHRAKI